MTTAELSSRFDLICDKVGSPYFTATEKADFFNTAQLSIIDEIIFPTKKQDRKDVDIFDFSREDAFQQGIGTLVRTATVTGATNTTRNTSVITFTQINTALVSGTVYKVIDFLVQNGTGSTTYNSAKRVRTINSASRVYGNLRTFNSFTNNTGRSAIYTISSFASGTTGTTSQGQIEFFPVPTVTGSSYLVEVVVFPRTISITGSVVNPEIDAMFHNELLFRSLQLAGISIREKELYDGTNIEQAKEQ
jgi:hypothetical protein